MLTFVLDLWFRVLEHRLRVTRGIKLHQSFQYDPMGARRRDLAGHRKLVGHREREPAYITGRPDTVWHSALLPHPTTQGLEPEQVLL